MKIIINILIVLGIIGLAYLLVQSIQEPIAFKAEKDKREDAVVDKLKKIRQTQEVYRGVTGTFAHTFDTLEQVIKTGRIAVEKVIGDPDDPSGVAFTIDTIWFNAADSVRALGIKIDSLRFVPYGDNVQFDIDADTLTFQQTLVSVTEVKVQRKKFMGAYGDKRFAKYDDGYDPSSTLKFGSMDSPNLTGNWER